MAKSPAPPTDEPDAPPVAPAVDKLVRTYTAIRAARDAARKEYEAKDAELGAQLDMIKAALLEHCKANSVESVKTKFGTFYRSLKVRYWPADWEAMHKFILARGVPELLEKRLNQSAVKEYLTENPDDPLPGLNTEQEYTITVRRA